MRSRWTRCLAVALSLVAALPCGCGRPKEGEIAVAVESPLIHGVGYVEPVAEVRRLAFAQAGRVAKCMVEPGQRVEAGAVLAAQEAGEESALLGVAEAELALARAELEALEEGAHPAEVETLRAREQAAAADLQLARQELERHHSLSRNGAGLRSQAEDSRVRVQSAEAWQQAAAGALREAETRVRSSDKGVALRRVDVASARLQLARERLDRRTLRAPVAGTVLEVLRRAGDRVQDAGEDPVLLLGDLDRLRVRAEVDETQALLVGEGAAAWIGGPNLHGREMEGRVAGVKPIMGPKTVFSRAAAERQDLEMRQVFIPLPAGTALPVGLKVDVRISPASSQAESDPGGKVVPMPPTAPGRTSSVQQHSIPTHGTHQDAKPRTQHEDHAR